MKPVAQRALRTSCGACLLALALSRCTTLLGIDNDYVLDAGRRDGAGGESGVSKDAGDGASPRDAGRKDADASPPSPNCGPGAKVGFYCGGDKVFHANKNTLYACNGPGPPTQATKCKAGCVVAPAGSDDYCKVPTG
jgi:hypothetical protein